MPRIGLGDRVQPPPALPRRPLLAFLLALLSLGVGGLWILRDQERELRSKAETELTLVSRLKVDQIKQWRAERLADASVLTESQFLAEGLAESLSSPRPAVSDRLRSSFRSVQEHYGYDDVLVADTLGNVRWSASGTTGRLDASLTADLSRAFAERRAVIGDLQSGPGTLPPHLDVVAPIFEGSTAEAAPAGAVILQTHAHRFLYPLIASWPTPSRTAETLLVRREGDAVLYLNDLRHRQHTALELRVPLSSSNVPAVMAAFGKRGLVRGVDYRGIEVLAHLAAVPDSPWIVVAKIDAREALSAWRLVSTGIVAFIVGLVALAATALLALWQRSRSIHYKTLLLERRRSAEVVRQSEDQSRAIFEVASIGMAQADPRSGRWLRVNPKMCEITGYSESELLELRVPDITHPEDREADWQAFQRVIRGEAPSYRIEKRYLRKDGSQAWVNVNMTVLRDQAGQPVRTIGVIEDIGERKQAEKALRESQARYQALFENMLDGYAYCRMHYDDQGSAVDWTYLDVNPAFERLTGLNDVTGRLVSEVIPGLRETNAELFELYGRVALGGAPERYETYVPALGSWFSTAVFGLARGEFVVVFDNVTHRKQAEAALRESEERYRTVAEFTYDWEYWRAPDGRFLYVSPACDRVTGYAASAFLEDRGLLERITHPDDRAALDAHHAVLAGLGEERAAIDIRIVRRDGREVWINHSCLPVFDAEGRGMGRRGSNRDVTDRKQAEDAIRHLNENLEQRVRERTAELEAVNRELEAFSYSVSHDLRAPLRGIDGWSLALWEDYHDTLDEQARQYLERVRREAQRMGVLIDDMLRLSRVTRAALQPQRVDLGEVARAVVARLRANDPDRVVELNVQPNLTALGDPTLLEVALSNLLENAWKFSGARSPAHIEFGRARSDGHEAFFVRDDGAGFDMAFARKLFGAFQRMHSMSEFPGTGIGLATVQRIVHRHGGRVWAEAEVDKGATFYFTLEDGG